MSEQQYAFPASKMKAPEIKETVITEKDDGVVLVSCGSFNPITTMHMRIFESAKDYFEKELQVPVLGGFCSPVHQKYGERKPGLLTSEHRLSMCNLALQDSDWVTVDDWEITQPDYSRTRPVLKHFEDSVAATFPQLKNVRIVLLCGADLLESMAKPGVWIAEHVEFILSHHGVACVEREGVNLKTLIFETDVFYKHRKNIHIIPSFISNDVSSTKIRKLANRGYSIKYFVHDDVQKYIVKHKLYQ